MCSYIIAVKVIRHYAEKLSPCCTAVVDCLYAVHLLPSRLHHCSVLLFPCKWISEEVFHLEKLHHLTGTTVKGSRLTFQDPAIQHVLSNCLFCRSLPCPISFPPCLDFHLISFWLIKKKMYDWSYPNMLTTLSSCAPSHHLLRSHAVIPHHKWTNESGAHMGAPSHCTTTPS